MCPIQKGTDLYDDIMALIKFWHSMHSDKKYLRPENVTITGNSLSSLCLDIYVAIYSLFHNLFYKLFIILTKCFYFDLVLALSPSLPRFIYLYIMYLSYLFGIYYLFIYL